MVLLTDEDPIATLRAWLDEARAASLVAHPGLVKVFDFNRLPDGTVYIMMELIEGNCLITINVGDFFAGRVETPEQLEAAIAALRQRIEKLLGEGKKVWIQ